MPKPVPLEHLVFDVEFWPRLMRDEGRVTYLAELLKAGLALPPIKIQQGTNLVLGGWHTVAACRLIGQTAYFAEIVDIPPDERLLFAYREDVAAALPYSDADVKSVARRLYKLRLAANGTVPTAAKIAEELGRSERTVHSWLADLIGKAETEATLKRQARELAVQALLAAGLSTRAIAALVKVDQKQVRTDGNVAVTPHLADSRLVAAAQALIEIAIGAGLPVETACAARDWIIAQTDPDFLRRRELRHAWNVAGSALEDCREQLADITIPDCQDSEFETIRTTVRGLIAAMKTRLGELEGRVG